MRVCQMSRCSGKTETLASRILELENEERFIFGANEVGFGQTRI